MTKLQITQEPEGWVVWNDGKWVATFLSVEVAQNYVDMIESFDKVIIGLTKVNETIYSTVKSLGGGKND